MTDPDCAQVRAEIQRLTDEVAFLTRSRDEWREFYERAISLAKEATMELQRVREERESWRKLARKAESQLAAGGAE